jgi:hypothetical protein
MDDIGRAEMTLDLDRLVKAGAERADLEAFTSPEIA